MKALTVRDMTITGEWPWASLIESGLKTIETRTWPIPKNIRLPIDLLICASKASRTENAGKTVCVVRLLGCEPMTVEHEQQAQCPVYPGAWAWHLDNLRWLPYKFPVKGQLGFFEIDVPVVLTLVVPTAEQLSVKQREVYYFGCEHGLVDEPYEPLLPTL